MIVLNLILLYIMRNYGILYCLTNFVAYFKSNSIWYAFLKMFESMIIQLFNRFGLFNHSTHSGPIFWYFSTKQNRNIFSKKNRWSMDLLRIVERRLEFAKSWLFFEVIYNVIHSFIWNLCLMSTLIPFSSLVCLLDPYFFQSSQTTLANLFLWLLFSLGEYQISPYLETLLQQKSREV